MKVYIYETFHRCESVTDWILYECSLDVDSTEKSEGKRSIKMTNNDGLFGSIRYEKTMDWSGFHDLIFWTYHPGRTTEKFRIWIFTDDNNYKYWELPFGAVWEETVLDFDSVADGSLGTLDMSNITKIGLALMDNTDPGEDYYFDFFHGRSIDITSDVINGLSFIEHAVRDCPKAEFMAKGTWLPSRDYTIEILDYYTSNGSTTADQIIFEGSVTDYELTFPRKIWCVSRAKNDLDEFRPNGAYNGDLDSNHIKTLIAECSYITEGTIDATTGNTDNLFKGDKTFRTILNDWADKHLKHWYLSPTGALTFNDAGVDSGAVLHYHKGTYNFRDDTIGSVPSGWTANNGASCSTRIVASILGHKKVLDISDQNAGAYCEIRNDFTARPTGTIEGWFYGTDVTKTLQIVLSEAGGFNGYIKIAADKIQYYYAAAWHDATGGGVSDGTLYRFKITFDCTADTYDFYLNGTLLDADVAFGTNATNIDRFYFYTATADTGYHYYIDAIGYSWDSGYNVGDNLKGDPFQCWNVKPKKHVDSINWVVLLGGIVAGTQISQESKDQPSIDQLGPKIYKDTYAFITVEAQLLIAANNLRTREQLLPLAINLWSYEANRGLIQASECVWFAQSKANPEISPRKVIINKIIYRFLSGHTNLQTTDGIAFKKDKDKALSQENSLLLQQ